MLTKNFKQLQSGVAAHAAADRVSQGSYKTCFIGCLANQKDDPRFIEETYGIPEPLLRLSESIFENLSHDEAVDFFAKFPEAVESDDKDLTLVVWHFLALELRASPPASDEVQALTDSVIEGMDLLSRGEPWPGAQAAVDVYVAFAADRFTAAPYIYAAAAAGYAARAAACSAGAAVVARCIDPRAATKAFQFATAAANSLGDAALGRQRDTLLRLIKEAPINTQEKN